MAADPEPLDAAQQRDALIAGRWTYDVLTQSGRPWKLRARHPSVPTTAHEVVATHACGAAGRDATDVTELPEDPRSARVSASGHQDPRSVFAQPQTGHDPRNPASAATQRRSDPSDRAHRCTSCRKLIQPGELYVAIDHALLHWAQHDVCP